ncbi:ribonuclease HI [Candidatus Purcelliella pentastirinorum]|uniref:Ribonuclease H n=1 Tax=Candidatus Purcelliella pentastirinorum TaxID=472834 RepID=A0AAX3N717_9ENTR|nr:ribonuclease HI [Candidatus Purcelliella pentastirinorum]WDI78369.1 ribonuclease HI [Candidatus Purcelliella pentastirinorum]WDR80604.1 ribonuclease HI [Candidatus Purcelliella pentastirinorum]
MLKKNIVFIDGSCIGNPGPGGYGVFIRNGLKKIYFSAGFFLTTNNRMEIMAAIVALEYFTIKSNIIIYTDSTYLRSGITEWILNWKKRNWRTYNNSVVKNVDLWIRLEKAINCHIIHWEWVKGHTGDMGNELCDRLARRAAKNPFLNDIFC